MPNTEVRRPLERSANYAFCFSVRSGNFYSTISIISGKTFTRIKGSANPHKTYPRPIKNRLFSGKPKICEGPFSNYAGTEKINQTLSKLFSQSFLVICCNKTSKNVRNRQYTKKETNLTFIKFKSNQS